MNAGRYSLLVLVVTVFLPAAPTHAKSARKLVDEGNALYAARKLDEAQSKYDEALARKPESAQVKYNKANAAFRQDDFAGAIELYKQAAAASRDVTLTIKAKYNLGNSLFKQSLDLQTAEPEKAIEGIERGIAQWRDVVDMNPEHKAAVRNIEVGRLAIKKLRRQIDRQKQQQQKQQQMKEQLEELLADQKDLAEQTEKNNKEQQEGKQSPQEAQQKNQDLAAKQSQLQEKTAEAMEQMQQSEGGQPPPQMQEAASELQKASDQQQKAAEQLSESKGADAKESQHKAAEQIEKAIEKLSQDQHQDEQQQDQQDQEQDQQDQQEQPQPQESEQEQPGDEGDKQAAAIQAQADEILDKERKDRKRRQIMISGRRKVEKDW